MWKITRLYLKNFIHIYAGMGNREVELDLSTCDKKINIFIGKMGSGKSSILGHLQPFSTYGTLDIRNQEDLIISEEDGLKEIDYIHNGNEYKIQHKYTWNKSTRSHNIKSFIQLNGNELNESGNNRSFKEIIRTEFGIDQNFLRLLRLGPNVSNLISMKSTERKSFIASLLKDTEIYATLYQKLSEDYRNMNSALNVLSNKLTGLSSDKENELKCELEDNEGLARDLEKKISSIREEIAKLKGINSTLLGFNNSMRSYEEMIISCNNTISQTKSKLDNITKLLVDIPDISLQEVSVEYGKISFEVNSIYEDIINLQTKYSDNKSRQEKINESLLLADNNQQLKELERSFNIIKAEYDKSLKMLEGFTCGYSYSYLVSVPDTIENFQMYLEEMCVNKKGTIDRLYKSDSSIISWAKKKMEILVNSKSNTEKLLSNIKFAAEYQCPIPLYRPPMCPTMSCPFIQTHPEYLKQTSSVDERAKTAIKLRDQIRDMEIQIAVYEDYITQYPKMTLLKKMWNSLSEVLRNIGVLREDNLYRLLVSLDARCNWYDYNTLVKVTEKEKAKEEFTELQNRYYKIQNEIYEFQSTDISNNREELEKLQKEESEILTTLEEKKNSHQRLSDEKDRLEKLLSTMKNIEYFKSEKESLERSLEQSQNEMNKMEDNLSTIKNNLQRIKILESDLASIEIKYTECNSKVNKLSMRLQEITTTKSSYNEYLNERNIIKLILDAVSSKDGIPLIMVKIFLDECKEIINDLISDIFDDELEIIDFNISENSNEFKIPYRINGNEVPDIELASQGQCAIISIAMSFALCRKSMFDYNVILLDEIDNSIYKSDREKFIMILSKQMEALGTEQAFLITHNDIFQQSGLPVNIIMTTPENIDAYPNQSIMRIY